MSVYSETSTRSVLKTISWRVVATLTTATIVWLVTGRLTLALAIGGIEAVSKMVLYYGHERLWDRIRVGRRVQAPAVIWFTGLSGSGKSTIALWVAQALEREGHKVERLDGDTIRDIFPATGFTRPERDQHIRRVGYLASRLEKNGVFVVASLVSPYQDSRDFVRGLCDRFLEVYVATPLEECERRDVKGLYAKARRGEIANFTGIDDPYEQPSAPELTVDTSGLSVEQAGRQVLKLAMKSER
ncbi:MAG: adenylyl-sulfate kinase [Gemmatimonadales bacterium]